MTKKKSAHIISHSHWDREWYMSFEQHRYYLVKLMDTLLDLFKKDSQFQSFHLDGQTIILEDYLEIKPERREELKELIQNKKLHIGPWYVLQDAFLTSGEANVRNLLYGFQDAKEFGAISKLGYFPDTFGIYGQAPQLLKQAGIDTAAFGRGVKPTGFNNTVSDMKSFESPYSEMQWVAPDGSSVLGILFANWYSNGNEVPTDPEEARSFWERKLQEAEKYASTPHLLFMNGCDHQPVQQDVGAAIHIAKELYPDIEFIHSNFDDYIQAVKEGLPDNLQTIRGELRNQRTDGWSTLVNTASSRIYLKQMNQECQTLLEKVAEPLSVLSHLTGGEYPRDYLRYAWKTLMKNHPHDSICGCSVDEVHQEMEIRFKKVKQTADMIINDKAMEIASKINTGEMDKAIPLVVFNTSGKNRSVIVEKEIELEKVYFSEMAFSEIPAFLKTQKLPAYHLTNSKGQEILFTIEELDVRFGYDLPEDAFRRPYYAKRAKITFIAENLSHLGYQTFFLQNGVHQHVEEESIIKQGTILENEFLQVDVHEDGSYTLCDKLSGKVYPNQGSYENTGDIGNEYMFKKAEGRVYTTKGLQAEIKTIENSSIKGTIAITHYWEIPEKAAATFEGEKERLIWHRDRVSGRSERKVTIKVITYLTLEKGGKGLKVKAVIDNQAMDHRIRVLYPTNLSANFHYADSVFEIAKRPNSPESEWENPSFDHHQHAFVSISDGQSGLTIANKGLQEYEIVSEGNTIAVTLLRSVSELGDWGWFPTPEAQCIGINSAEWMVIPHEGDITGEAFEIAYHYQTPVVAVQTDVHKGHLPCDQTFFAWEGEHLAVSSIKLAESSNDVLIRWFNTTNHDSLLTAEIIGAPKHYESTILEEKRETFTGSNASITVRPFEIKTIGWGEHV